jgi:hypothetical protein
MGFDTKCYDLAAFFLSDLSDIDHHRSRDDLAQTIQTAIEDWIRYAEGPCEICGEARGKAVHNTCVRKREIKR